MDPIAQIFDRMDKWRHFPSYQLERRADILFSLYLREVLEARMDFPVCDEFVPEFPVRIGSIDPGNPRNESFKIDYLALSADGQQPIFVELKTDGMSRRDEQDQYLQDARGKGLACLLDGLIAIFQATQAKRKYYHLLVYLGRMGLLELPNRLCTIMESGALRGATEAAGAVRNLAGRCNQPIICYVQPLADRDDVISFAEFAAIVAKHDDPLSQRFAQSLQEWAAVKAGNWTPGSACRAQRSSVVDASESSNESMYG